MLPTVLTELGTEIIKENRVREVNKRKWETICSVDLKGKVWSCMFYGVATSEKITLSGTLLSIIKEWITDTCNTLDESQGNCTEWNKANLKNVTHTV